MPHEQRNTIQEYQFCCCLFCSFGIENKDGVVVYDGKGIFKRPSCFGGGMFRVFGHESVWVLDGGLPKWRASGYEVESSAYAILKSNVASEAAEKVYQGQPVSLFIHTFMFCFSGLGLTSLFTAFEKHM
uniref:Rhodanese domain-containing protein n=1 Tax=Brassica oleracea TaxID=3712 RepID=A0A3P6EMN4_BRAOL|nr:unnamed protein product [Brassica oleracea]